MRRFLSTCFSESGKKVVPSAVKWVVAIVILACSIAAPAKGQTTESWNLMDNDTNAGGGYAPKSSPIEELKPLAVESGGWDVSAWSTVATGAENGPLTQARLWMAGMSFAKPITGEFGGGIGRGVLEYGFDLIPLFRTQKSQHVYGGGFEPLVLRWTSTAHRGKLVPYLEGAGGGIFTSADLPPGNTSFFNFTVTIGPGIQILRGGRQSVDIACRYRHLSNANLGTQNPSFNGIELSLGYHWFTSHSGGR
jgi:hypothetical protein